jgi:hypothetical protein
MIRPFESDFEFPLVQVDGKFAVEAWEYFARDPSISPVIIGDPENELYISEAIEFGETISVEQIIAKAEALEFPKGLQVEKRAELSNMLEAGKGDQNFEAMFGHLDLETEIDPKDILSDWPKRTNKEGNGNLPSVAINWSTGKPIETTLIALIPTADWTEIPAYLRFGGYNDCPAPHWHVAAMRHWRDIYDVRLIGLSHDTLDLRIGKHPQTKKEAAQQAINLYEYCPDLVDQGSGSISELARDLMSHRKWSLWWD